MEPLVETLDLDIEESNDLAFKIKMEGMSASPAKVRLVCEGKDVSYMFNGYATGEDEVVQFTLPKMDSWINEGVYQARVEVLVDNRYFAPLQFQINFKKVVSVVAESIKVVPKAPKQEVKVTASPIIAPKPAAPTIKIEQKKPAPVQAAEEASPLKRALQELREEVGTAAPPRGRGTLKQKFGR